MDLMELAIPIKVAGDRAAMAALAQVETAGKKAASGITMTTEQTRQAWAKAGGDMTRFGQIASQMATTSQTAATKQVAAQVQVQAAIKQTTDTARLQSDALRMRVGMGAIAMAGALNIMADQGKVTAGALKQIVVQGSMMAAMYGPQGAIIGAVGVAGVALFSFFTRAKREAEELRKKTEETATAIRKMGWEQAQTVAQERRVDLKALEAERARLVATNRQRTIGGGQNTAAGTVGVNDTEIAALDLRLAAARTELTQATDRATYSAWKLSETNAAAARITADQTRAEKALAEALREVEAERENALRNADRRIAALPELSVTPDLGAYRTAKTPTVDPKSTDLTDEIREALAIAQAALDDASIQFHQMLDSIIVNGFSSALQNAFAAAFSGEGLSGIFQNFASTMMAALGQAILLIGVKLINLGGILIAFENALKTLGAFAGPAALIGGAALIALAGTMVGGSSSGGRGGSGGGRSAPGPTTYALSPQAMSAGQGITPRPAFVYSPTIIGNGDPVAQRSVAMMVRAAHERGIR